MLSLLNAALTTIVLCGAVSSAQRLQSRGREFESYVRLFFGRWWKYTEIQKWVFETTKLWSFIIFSPRFSSIYQRCLIGISLDMDILLYTISKSTDKQNLIGWGEGMGGWGGGGNELMWNYVHPCFCYRSEKVSRSFAPDMNISLQSDTNIPIDIFIVYTSINHTFWAVKHLPFLSIRL